MSELISGKEAKLAWANGEDVEFYLKSRDKWFPIRGNTFVSVFDDAEQLRIKPQPVVINGIEVPAPFKPKKGDKYWHIYQNDASGYSWALCGNVNDHLYTQFGAWRTETEVKQVVELLWSFFQ